MDFEKRRRLEEVHKFEHTGITDKEWAVSLASVVKYIPGQLLEVILHVFIMTQPVFFL